MVQLGIILFCGHDDSCDKINSWLTSLKDFEIRLHGTMVGLAWVEQRLFHANIRCLIDQSETSIDDSVIKWFRAPNILQFNFSDKIKIYLNNTIEIQSPNKITVHKNALKVNVVPVSNPDYFPLIERLRETDKRAYIYAARKFIDLYPEHPQIIRIWYDISIEAYYAGVKELGKEACDFLINNESPAFMKEACKNNLIFYT